MAHSGQAGLGVPPSFFPGSQNPLLSVWQAFQIACTIFKYGHFHVSTSSRMKYCSSDHSYISAHVERMGGVSYGT